MSSRRFETEPDCSMADGLQMIRAALSDEGLALGPKSGSADGVTSVIRDGMKFFTVPESRIVTPEEDAEMREVLEAARRKEATS